MHLQITHLTTFVAVVQHGSMTTASSELPCALSTVSTHVATLERQIGARLLLRHEDGCTPTATGQVVATLAHDLLRVHERIVTAPQQQDVGHRAKRPPDPAPEC